MSDRIRDYTKLIESGNRAQIEKLKQNEHKRGFEDIDVYYAYHRIIQELDELKKELYCDRVTFNRKEQYDLIKTRNEAADIANFAHMIILKCDQELNRSC